MTQDAGITELRVVPWELYGATPDRSIWGIAYRRPDGRRVAYMVGSRAIAEKELTRIAEGEYPDGVTPM